jgi:hypothetical protein
MARLFPFRISSDTSAPQETTVDDLESAIVSAHPHVTADRTNDWFATIAELIDEAGTDWPGIRDALMTRCVDVGFPPGAVESLSGSLDEASDARSVLATLAERRAELAELFHSLVAVDGDPSEPRGRWDPTLAYDWYYALTVGKDWGGWSGADEDWTEFRNYFLYVAETDNVLSEATAFLDEIEASPDRRAALEAIGVSFEAPVEQADLDWGEQSAAWYVHLVGDNGWTGDEAEWEAFRDRFLQAAHDNDVAAYAEAFLARVEQSPSKSQTLEDLGIVVEGTPAPDGADDALEPSTDPADASSEDEDEEAEDFVEFITSG